MRRSIWPGMSALIFILSVPWAHAFPEMVRHGYVNCTACHVSPSGGGVLTPYGRELSKEVLSSMGRDGEAMFAYGLVRPPEWLVLGGDIRNVYVYRNTPFVQEGRLILMQADLEAAATYVDWSLVGTLGYQEKFGPSSFTDRILSRRHYLMRRFGDEFTIRAGRFFYSYGINMPDHAVLVRGGLPGARTGLGINDQGSEAYNLEGAWNGETLSLQLTGIFGQPDVLESRKEKGVAVNASVAPSETYKVGFSYLYGDGKDTRRSVFGPYGILGFTPRFFLLSELDFQTRSFSQTGRPEQWGLAQYHRLNYEFRQGVHGYLTYEQARLDFGSDRTLAAAYGAGIQYFPRPHFEFNFLWQKQLVSSLSSEPSDAAWLMIHFYP